MLNIVFEIQTEIQRRELAEASLYELGERAIRGASEMGARSDVNQLGLTEVELGGAVLYPLLSGVYGWSPKRKLSIQNGELAYAYAHTGESYEAVAVYGAVWPHAQEVATYAVKRNIELTDQSGQLSIGDAFGVEPCADNLYLPQREDKSISYRPTEETTVNLVEEDTDYHASTTKEAEIILGGPLAVTSIPNYIRVMDDQLQQPVEPNRPVTIEIPENLSRHTVTVPASTDRVIVKDRQLVALDRYRNPDLTRSLADLQREAEQTVGGWGSSISDPLFFQFGISIISPPSLNSSDMHPLVADAIGWRAATKECIDYHMHAIEAQLPTYDPQPTKDIARSAILSKLSNPGSHITPVTVGTKDTVDHIAAMPRNYNTIGMLPLYRRQ